MEYTFPTPAIRKAVRETRGASFEDADDSTPEFATKIEVDRPDGRVATANPIIEMARADGYVVVGGTFTPSHEFPPDIDLDGRRKGRLVLQFEPTDDDESDTSALTASDLHAELSQVADGTKEYDRTEDHRVQFRFDGDDEDETAPLDIESPLKRILESDALLADVSVSERRRGAPNVFLLVRFGDPNPFKMAGMNTREQTTLPRHDALTLVDALDQYDGDKNIGHLRSKLVDEHNLERYLQYLD